MPPSKEFRSVGMICTTTENPPPVSADCMRCVHRSLVREEPIDPVKVWDDVGSTTGGRPGCLWTYNNMKMLLAKAGGSSEPPTGTTLIFKEKRFMMGDAVYCT